MPTAGGRSSTHTLQTAVKKLSQRPKTGLRFNSQEARLAVSLSIYIYIYLAPLQKKPRNSSGDSRVYRRNDFLEWKDYDPHAPTPLKLQFRP